MYFKLVLVRTAFGTVPALAKVEHGALLAYAQSERWQRALQKRVGLTVFIGRFPLAESSLSFGAEALKADFASVSTSMGKDVELKKAKRREGFGLAVELLFATGGKV